MRDADVLADLAQGDVATVQPRQDLGDLELVVEVGLEPQDDVAAVAGERRVTPMPLRDIGVQRLRAQVGAPAQDRALVQRVAPGQRVDPELGERGDRAVAVGDVQGARAGSRCARAVL